MRLLLPMIALLGLSSLAAAAVVAPCTLAPGVVDIVPLSNPTNTYCVSDYGWSDTWFVGSAPSIYDPRLDVFSGDDSPNLRFGILGGEPVVSGFGWLSPIMDVGTLEPTVATGSVWEVVTPVHGVALNTVASELHHPLGLNIMITTSLGVTGQITQGFLIENTSLVSTFTGLRFADYFNFHPNGSTRGNSMKGTISYDPLSGLTVTGLDDGTLIANGSMRGERSADAHGCSSPVITWDMVQTNTYVAPCPVSPLAIGPGDVAGGLAWDLSAALAPGASVEFTIFKQAEPLPSPEPSTLILFLSGLAFLRTTQSVLSGRAAKQRRRKKKTASVEAVQELKLSEIQAT